jgi:hypothetical protein
MAEYHALRFMVLFGCLSGVGCATVPYQFGKVSHAANDGPRAVVFAYGKPNAPLDKLAWVVGLPSRILPLHGGINNHSLSQETADKLESYLQDNGLEDVYVRVNQYDPVGEWHRLRDNDRVAAPWRYSVGMLGLVGYTILPGRVFGGDLYNPFTDSLYINSDVSAVVLGEAAYAKDVRRRKLPGTYATINEFPVLALWRHVHAVNDLLGYARETNDWELERETYRVVYPQMGIHAAGGGHTIATFFTSIPIYGIPLVACGGACVGHALGQSSIAQRKAELEQEESEIELVDHAELAQE